jgi:hypothetical protein
MGKVTDVPFWFLVALRAFIMIDEWGLYLSLGILLWLEWYWLAALVGIFGALCVTHAYRYYWRLLDAKCLEAES